jgi:hypothetical protein
MYKRIYKLNKEFLSENVNKENSRRFSAAHTYSTALLGELVISTEK